MVDRICADRTVLASGDIAIEAESHQGSIVMLEPPKPQVDGSDPLIPLGGENVMVRSAPCKTYNDVNNNNSADNGISTTQPSPKQGNLVNHN